MPELPEVETVRRQLDTVLAGARIVDVHILQRGREFPSGEAFRRSLLGKRILHVSRRAKLLLWDFEDGTAMAAHLKMTGRFVFVPSDVKLGKHDRLLFQACSADGANVFVLWSDVRKFGFVKILSADERAMVVSGYGPEPLESSAEELANRLLVPKTRKVKAALLNQEVIAGIGNIYADEALHRAGIRPTRLLGKIRQQERLGLAKHIQEVLSESLAQQGTSANDYVDTRGERGGFLDFLRVYGREGEPCRQCGHPISRMVLNQRGTHFCSTCQT